MTYIQTHSIANDTANGSVNLGDLHDEIAADATILADAASFLGCSTTKGSDDLLITFDIEPQQAAKDALATAIGAHQGTPGLNMRFLLSVSLNADTKFITSDATWEELGGAVSQLETFAPLEQLMGVVGLSYKVQEGAGGEKPEIRMCEHLSGTPSTLQLALYQLADTAGEWVNVQLPTTEDPRSGMNAYVVEAKRNSAASFELRYVTATIFHVIP